jgi:hypothetical protein
MVRGRHSNEIYAAAKKGDNSFFSEGVTDAPPPPPAPKKPEDLLTPEEKRIADRMKIPYDRYAKRKNEVGVATVSGGTIIG